MYWGVEKLGNFDFLFCGKYINKKLNKSSIWLRTFQEKLVWTLFHVWMSVYVYACLLKVFDLFSTKEIDPHFLPFLHGI